MGKVDKVVSFILTAVVEYLISMGFFAFGWNVCLVKVFNTVPTLGFKEVALLVIAVDFTLLPATIGLARSLNKIRKAVGVDL